MSAKGWRSSLPASPPSFVLWKIADVLLRVGVEIHFYMMFGMALAVLIGLAEASTLVIPYYRISQRLTHGSARWADVPYAERPGAGSR